MALGRHNNTGSRLSSRPRRLSAKWLILSSIVTVIGFSVICASVVFDMRRGEEALARQTLDNLASSIDADISRNLELYDVSLRAVAGSLVMPELKDVSKPIRQLILFNQAASAKHFGAIEVFDPEGRLTIDASTLDPPAEDRSDEEYFSIHRDHPDVGLFISRPMLHRGSYAIVLSRRITGADGRFLGVVVGSIRFSYFHELFSRLRLGPSDSITVVRRDGTVIMRTPFDLDVIGKNIGDVPGVKRALSEPSGSYTGLSVLDSERRLYVWRDSTNPLVVIVGKPWRDLLNLWQEEAVRIGATMTALVLFMLAVTLFLAREIGRRAQAEDKLEELATTDALTGLKNRRKFDATIDEEWRRAIRQQMPLALLMIDADHFKTYNDTFGHQAGDQVLIGIAICISDSVHRAGDCVARYGGEEFAVLLPGLAPMDALTVAEKIRLKVQQWSDGSQQINTVSIGVASMIPGATTDWCDLVRAADKALYAAKANGRNQSALASVPELTLAA
ncbi:diguanylate cyclase [Bradyrhizobium sp. dw_78]|uniref:sensor domain-containing diguanylate cyclase n=1 Tax=Bradyrhizobium sp. dw_78 TaxID=2719793 RepID=UPI001BD4EF6A|nr:diguanylate cyclase [Bradyrhizobium sp. dw_78]